MFSERKVIGYQVFSDLIDGYEIGSDFAQVITKALAAGWELHGTPHYIQQSNGTLFGYQALIFREKDNMTADDAFSILADIADKVREV